MRGDNPQKRFTAATIVDEKGDTRYYVVPTRLALIGLASLILLALITCVLGFLVFFNKSDIDNIKEKIKVEEIDNR